MFTLVCHPLEMANKINDADHILINLRFSTLSISNTRELTITLGFQSAIERADSPVREIICPCVKLICVFVFAYAKSGFSHDAAQLSLIMSKPILAVSDQLL